MSGLRVGSNLRIPDALTGGLGGALLFVDQLPDGLWATCYRRENGTLARLVRKSPLMRPRRTRTEAEIALRTYAYGEKRNRKNRWIILEDPA